MDVKCPGCYKITTVFSHAQGVVVCAGCSTILCQPTGGRAKLTEGKPINQLHLKISNCGVITVEEKKIINISVTHQIRRFYFSLQDARSDGSHTKHDPF